MKVVVVDDEESLLNLTSEFLKIKGYDVVSFSDSVEAQKWISENREDVLAIITDEIMPGAIQGHHLVEQFSADFPMMLMTGYIDSVELSKLNVPVIYKPFRMAAFAEAFVHTLENFKKSLSHLSKSYYLQASRYFSIPYSGHLKTKFS